jgi:hypothetical protein
MVIKFNKSILLISATPKGLKPTQGYLSSRGWKVDETNDLKQALHIITTTHPEVVVACIDHANKNIGILLDLVRQRLRCCVIVTSEGSTLNHHALIQDSSYEHKIYPPLSGPSVERFMSKYFKKLESLFGIVTAPDTKRSGISPKSFRLNINAKASENVIDYANIDFNRRFNIDLAAETKPHNPRHLLVKGTEKVINELIIPTIQKGSVTPLKKSTNVTCMLIECRSFNGYVVAALGEDCHLDEIFTALIYKHLIKFLEDQGEPVLTTDIFQMNIKPVAFLDWAAEYAEFLKQSVHKTNEIAFAFFPLQGVRASYQPSTSGEMLALPIEELYGDTKVGFDVYIFFPANNRYVLYTPSGAVFYSYQQQRLRERGVTTVHIKRDDLKELNRYRAQKYFNAIIDEYNSADDLPA